MSDQQPATDLQIKSVIDKAMGTPPAYWAPGATALGWSIAVYPGRVVINHQLGDVYRQRVAKGLAAAFESAGIAVQVETGVANVDGGAGVKAFHEYTLPAYYASALINGDRSGMSDEETQELDAWLVSNKPGACVSCSDESFFAWRNDATKVGGACLTFTFENPVKAP
jgi:uncharacterized protein involved in tolerance to divalent cations